MIGGAEAEYLTLLGEAGFKLRKVAPTRSVRNRVYGSAQ